MNAQVQAESINIQVDVRQFGVDFPSAGKVRE